MDPDRLAPDTKNWTWVLTRPCPDCGLDVGGVPRDELAGRLRDNAESWPGVLGRDDVRVRPDALTWSPLEYACHVRDVFELFARRLELMLDHTDPLFENWDQDETAVQGRYAEQDPSQVAEAAVSAGRALADRLDALSEEQWGRTGRRSDGADFTVDSFARYLLHDPVHHLHDVGGAPSPG